MWSICKKELGQFFSSLTGYIAIIVFLLVNGLMQFVFRNNILEYGYASLNSYFSLAPWILIFLVPAITMRSFADEYRSGTFEILRTRPLSNWQIVGGKFLGSLIVAIIALLPTIIYYFTINHLAATKGIDAGAAAGSYLGLIFLTAVFTAIGICVSSLTMNAVVSFIISLIACVLLYFGFTAISQLPALQNGADYYIGMVGIDFHYQSISRGVIDTRDVIYFISIVLFFLLIIQQVLLKSARKKTVGRLAFVVLIAGLFLINLAAAQWHQRFDLTQEKRYTISNATKDLLRNLDDQLNITVFLKGDLPADFRRLSSSTEDFVRTLRETNTRNVRYRIISPDEEIGNGRTWADSLKTLGIQPINLSVQVKSGQEIKNAYPIALLNYGGRSSIVDLYQGSTRVITPTELNNAESLMEYGFAKAIDNLENPQKPMVAYAVGNGEPTGPETFDLVNTLDPSNFDSTKQGNYSLKLLNIQLQKFIPDTFKVLMIVKPSETFTEDEKLKIDQYVMRGGKVLWFVDNLHAEQDSLSYKSELIAYERSLNLQDMWFQYGFRINPDLIMDLQCDFLPFAVGGDPKNPQFEFLHWNYYPLFETRSNHIINKNLGLVAGKFVNSIDTIEGANLRHTYLLQSSQNSRTIRTPALISPNENRNAPEDAAFKSHDIPAAMLLEGKFTSIYKARIGKVRIDSLQAFGGYREESVPNKMIIVADGDMVLNQISTKKGPLPMGMNLYTAGTQYEYQFANREFLLNCLEYLTSKSSISESRNKEVALRLLDTKKVDAEKTQWQLINIALPIAVIILFGLAYQQLRRRRYSA